MLKRFLLILVILLAGCNSSETIDFTTKTPLYNKINIELITTTASRPNPVSLNIFKLRLKQYHLCKHLIIKETTIPLNDPLTIACFALWDTEKLELLEDAIKSIKDSTDLTELNLFIIYLPGKYLQNDLKELAGIQYARNSIAVFKNNCNACENTVLLHEFGHILRIADESHHPNRKLINLKELNHCSNPKCCMYWTIYNEHSDFDENCQKELFNLFK